jgi:hypothetical protein
MTLRQHIRRLITVYGYHETIIGRPKEVREVLFLYGVTPSLNQVKQAIRKHTEYILYGRILTECECGNPRLHDFAACRESMEAEEAGSVPYYHCETCELYGHDRYADANGVVWIDCQMACEFRRRLLERTFRADEQMRRDMTYAFG